MMNYELPAVRGSKLSIWRGRHVEGTNRGRALLLCFNGGGRVRFTLWNRSGSEHDRTRSKT